MSIIDHWPSEQEKSASAIRYEQACRNMSYEHLARSWLVQAEAIAKHYTAHAMLAMNLRSLLQAREQSDDTAELDKAIQYLIEQIKRNHAFDFGIELEWRDLTNTNQRTNQP